MSRDALDNVTTDGGGSEVGAPGPLARRTLHLESLEPRVLLSTILVNSPLDSIIPISGDGLVTLREAVIAANTDAVTDLGQTGSGDDEIIFAPELAGETIVLGGQDIDITSDLTIAGLGADQLTIDAAHLSRIFNIDDGNSGDLLDVSISGLTLTSGQADNGGAVYNVEALRLSECVIAGNKATNDGGGVCNWSNSSAVLSDVVFSGNTSKVGGGMYSWFSSSAQLSSVVFTANTTSSSAGGMYIGRYSTGTVYDVTFIGNTSYNGAGMYVDEYSSPALRNVTFDGNAGGYGAGMYNSWHSSPILSNVIFTGNVASGGGGGMMNTYSSSPALTNVTFCGNVGAFGGAMYNQFSSSPMLSDVTFTGNSSGYGAGAMYNQYSSVPVGSNSILWGNTGSVYNDSTSSAAFAFSIVQGGWSGEGNLSVDPLFVRNPSPGADGVWGTADDDYGDLRLQANSPAINAGSNALLLSDTADLDGDGDTTEPLPLDLAGSLRIAKAVVDMGAYEFQNRAPIVRVDQGVVTMVEGQTAADSGAFSDPDMDAMSLTASLGTIIDNGNGTWSWSVSTLGMPDIAQDVSITATDSDGAATIALFELRVAPKAYVVDTLVDESDGDYRIGDLSLREALELANATPEDDMISFAGALFSSGTRSDIDLGLGQLTITGALDIKGPGQDLLYIDGQDSTRIIYVTAGADATISGMTLTGGHVDSGGAIFLDQAQLTLKDATVADNHAPGKGGGVYAVSSWAVFSNVTFSGNTSGGLGGGIYNYYSSGSLSDVIFSGNTAGSSGGGICNWTYCSPTLNNVVFDSNSAAEYGGGMYNVSHSSPELNGVVFSRNSARNGGGMANQSFSSALLTGVTFVGNTAVDGGGMWNDLSSSPTLNDVTFSGNVANAGGGMSNAGSLAELSNVAFIANRAKWGGGIYNFSSSPTLSQVTFSSNDASEAGGAMYSYYGSHPVMNNSVMWGNTAPVGGSLYDAPSGGYPASSTAAAYSLVEGGWAGEGNLDVDPLFVRNPSPGADGVWGIPDDDYGDLRLKTGSPAIDAGNSALLPPDIADLDDDGDTTEPLPFDLDGNPRLVGPSVDMGAYEVQNHAPVASDMHVETDEDAALVVALAATDADGDPLTYTLLTESSHGTLSGVGSDLLYTPATDWSGTDSFTYRANDGSVDSNEATVTIVVNPVNDVPVASDLGVGTDEDTDVAVTLVASDVEDDPLEYLVVTGPSHGALSGTGSELLYTPAADWSGTDSFSYKANDGSVDSNEATVVITVNPVNDAPMPDDQAFTVTEDGVLGIVLSARDAETSQSDLEFRIESLPEQGTLLKDGVAVSVGDTFSGPPTGLTYEPGASREGVGSDSFAFTVTDDALSSNPASVSIQITKAVEDGQVTVDTDGVVRIGGTDADDDIELTHDSTAQLLRVSINGAIVSQNIALADVTELRVWGRDGNDTLRILDLGIKSMLHGGMGDDYLEGGQADDLFFGGLGNDTLVGASGNDFLIGGDGSDRIVGSAGNDILVAGDVGPALRISDLRSVLADWVLYKSPDDEAEDDILDETLITDLSYDMLTGSSGADWFIINNGDKITDFNVKKNLDGDVVTYV